MMDLIANGIGIALLAYGGWRFYVEVTSIKVEPPPPRRQYAPPPPQTEWAEERQET